MLLKLDKVDKQFITPGGTEQEVLRQVSLAVDTGEAIAVIGPSGSGKSTLLNIMGALDQPTSGTVQLAGQDFSSLSDKGLAAIRNRDIGFVFQRHHLLPQCTLLENTLLPALAAGEANNNQVKDHASRLLERVGIGSRMSHRPGQLSGGECQRAAVVRALINRPSLLLADEPTGSLDAAAADNLGQLLLELNQEEGVALVVVTHSLELAGRMNRVYRLANAGLVQEAA